MTRLSLMVVLLLGVGMGLLSAAAQPAADAAGENVVEIDLTEFDIIPPGERWEFSPAPERRDVFYDLEEIYIGRAEIANMADGTTTDDSGGDFSGDDYIPPGATREQGLERAQAILAGVQQAMAGQHWEEALRKSQYGIKVLNSLAKTFEDDQELRQIIDKLARYAVLAEEAKLLEEAKEEFAKLELIVEGIMWSADERSLAIISGETFAAQDRVKNTLIVNIDVNRVDFMFTYKGRRFEFQRYIGE